MSLIWYSTSRATFEFMAGSLAQWAVAGIRFAHPGLPLALPLPPLRDFALDRLGDVAPHELTDVVVDRLDQLGAGAGDDRLQMRGKLHLEPGIDEQIEPLQHLHRNLLGERPPALL